jgi:hypothetical protein
VHMSGAHFDQDSHHDDLHFLEVVLRVHQERVAPPREEPSSGTLLPHVRITSSCINTVLSRCCIKSVGLPPRKISSFLGCVQHHLRVHCTGQSAILLRLVEGPALFVSISCMNMPHHIKLHPLHMVWMHHRDRAPFKRLD